MPMFYLTNGTRGIQKIGEKKINEKPVSLLNENWIPYSSQPEIT